MGGRDQTVWGVGIKLYLFHLHSKYIFPEVSIEGTELFGS